MFKKKFFFLFMIVGFSIHSQTVSKEFRSQKIRIQKDTIRFDSVAINPYYFKIVDSALKPIEKTEYNIEFNSATLIISAAEYPKITIEYFRLPEFLTKTYTPYDERLILPNGTNNRRY